MKLLSCVAAVVALATGCAQLQAYLPQPGQPAPAAAPPPTVSFKSESVTGRSLAGSRLDLVFVVHNPAGAAASIAGVHCALSLDGKPLADVTPAATLSIPPNGSAELHVPVDVHFAALAPAAGATAAYQAHGTVTVQTSAGPVSLPFDHAGTLALPARPTFAIGSPSITGVSFPAAGLAVPVRVKNPNDFPIDVSQLAGDVSLLGNAVARVNDAEHLAIAPGQTQTTRVAVQIPYRLLVTAALARQTLALGFNGLIQTGPDQVPLTFNQPIPVKLEAPQVTFGMPRLEHVGFTSATVVFPFEVKNPNALPLPLGEIEGALELSGNQVGTVKTSSLGLVAAGQTTRVEVPLTVELLGAARSVLSGGPTRVAFHGQVHADTSTLPISFDQNLSFQR